jgi:hypothetical protein
MTPEVDHSRTAAVIFSCIGGIFGLCCVAVWFYFLVHCLRDERKDGVEKLLWVGLMIFLPILGTLLYGVAGDSVSLKMDRRRRRDDDYEDEDDRPRKRRYVRDDEGSRP